MFISFFSCYSLLYYRFFLYFPYTTLFRSFVMKYISTRGGMTPQTFGHILLEGLAPDGGLAIPEHYPQVSEATLEQRSEEHTSELQSRGHLVCRLLLDKTNTV